MHAARGRKEGQRAAWVLPSIALALALMGCAGVYEQRPETGLIQKTDPQTAWSDSLGIEVRGLRLSAGGYMLDFRYRVLDPEKAAPLLDRKVQPYLIDSASGATLNVPSGPKVGSLRTTSRNKVAAGRSYYILFANPGRYLQAGSKVTLVAGDARISDLVVH